MLLLLQQDYFLIPLSQLIYIQKNRSPEEQQQQAVISVQAGHNFKSVFRSSVALNPFCFAHHIPYEPLPAVSRREQQKLKANFICAYITV